MRRLPQISLQRSLARYGTREEWCRGASEMCREWIAEIPRPQLTPVWVERVGGIFSDRTISHPFVARGEARIFLEAARLQPLARVWPTDLQPSSELERLYELRDLEAMDLPVLVAARSPRQAMARALRDRLFAGPVEAAAVRPFAQDDAAAAIVTAEDMGEADELPPALPRRFEFLPV